MNDTSLHDANPGEIDLGLISLVFALCGLFFGPLGGIPAIICGHTAFILAKRKGMPLVWKRSAICGVILGYLTTLSGLFGGNMAIEKARKVTSLATASALESAVTDFHTEYGTWPLENHGEISTSSPQGVRMLELLLGSENQETSGRRPRFLHVKEGRNHKNGLVYNADRSKLLGLFDPWGNGYILLVSDSGNINHQIKRTGSDAKPSSEITIPGRKTAVYSMGPDRIPGTSDDVKTWQTARNPDA